MALRTVATAYRIVDRRPAVMGAVVVVKTAVAAPQIAPAHAAVMDHASWEKTDVTVRPTVVRPHAATGCVVVAAKTAVAALRIAPADAAVMDHASWEKTDVTVRPTVVRPHVATAAVQ